MTQVSVEKSGPVRDAMRGVRAARAALRMLGAPQRVAQGDQVGAGWSQVCCCSAPLALRWKMFEVCL